MICVLSGVPGIDKTEHLRVGVLGLGGETSTAEEDLAQFRENSS